MSFDETVHLQLYPPERFFGTILPQVNDYELCRVKENLGIVSITAWITEAMGGTIPSESSMKEDAAFASIAKIFNDVVSAVKDLDLGVPLVQCKDSPTRPPEGDVQYKTKPDAFFARTDTQLPRNCEPAVDRLKWKDTNGKPPNTSWVDIAGTSEYKKVSNLANEKDVSLLLNPTELLATKICIRMLENASLTCAKSWPMILAGKRRSLSRTRIRTCDFGGVIVRVLWLRKASITLMRQVHSSDASIIPNMFPQVRLSTQVLGCALQIECREVRI
jgi:hypothetical protein